MAEPVDFSSSGLRSCAAFLLRANGNSVEAACVR